ncbi:MAG: 30S ribosomal protein S8 [Planctomycetota bacterium]
MTDPIADMLTRIRNALAIRQSRVRVPHSKIKVGIADLLKREGYIEDYKIQDATPGQDVFVYLKYGPDGEEIIRRIERVSKPGCRVYRPVDEIRPVLRGLGTAIYSTPKGILSDRQCRKERVGGEHLATVW